MDYKGNKGILYVELRTTGAKVDAHSMNAPLIENPAWKAVWALNTFKDNKERITIDEFHDDIKEPNKEEHDFLNNTEFGLKEFKEAYGLKTLLPGDKNIDIWKYYLELSDEHKHYEVESVKNQIVNCIHYILSPAAQDELEPCTLLRRNHHAPKFRA